MASPVVEWIASAGTHPDGHVQVARGGLQVVVPEHALEGDQIRAQLQVVGREAVPQGVHPSVLVNVREFLGLQERSRSDIS